MEKLRKSSDDFGRISRKNLIVIALSMLTLVGCGAENNGNNSGFEEGFEAGFANSFIDSCSQSLNARNFSQEEVDFSCNCMLQKTVKRYPGTEKLFLSNEQVGEISIECAAQWEQGGQ